MPYDCVYWKEAKVIQKGASRQTIRNEAIRILIIFDKNLILIVEENVSVDHFRTNLLEYFYYFWVALVNHRNYHNFSEEFSVDVMTHEA